jgi:hypothetical protein
MLAWRDLPVSLNHSQESGVGRAVVDPAVRTVVDRAVTVFERDLGCTVERADPGWEDPYEALLTLILAENDLAGMRRMADELGERMSPHLVEVLRFYWLSFTFPFNFTGQPAATVPAGFTEDGLPVGLQIVGRRMDDALVLRASAAFEAAAPWRDRWPAIVAESGLSSLRCSTGTAAARRQEMGRWTSQGTRRGAG